MRKHFFFFLLGFLTAQFVAAQSSEVLAIRKYRNENTGTIMSEFSEFLSLPNVAADPVGQQKNA